MMFATAQILVAGGLRLLLLTQDSTPCKIVTKYFVYSSSCVNMPATESP